MATKRRMGALNSETRAQLIDAANRIITDEGYAAVTTRRLADEVGLKRHIVHYYFGTMEDLFVAVIRQNGDRLKNQIVESIQSGNPLEAIWKSGSRAGPQAFEMMALAMRHRRIQAEVKRYVEDYRILYAEALQRYLDTRGISLPIPTAAAAALMTGISQSLAAETLVDVDIGHDDAKIAIEEWLRQYGDER